MSLNYPVFPVWNMNVTDKCIAIISVIKVLGGGEEIVIVKKETINWKDRNGTVDCEVYLKAAFFWWFRVVSVSHALQFLKACGVERLDQLLW